MQVLATLRRWSTILGKRLTPLWRAVRPVVLPIWNALRLTVEALIDKNADLMAAGLSFYALISIAPLLVIAVAVGGLVVGTDLVQAEIRARISEQLGEKMADFVASIATAAQAPTASIVATILSIIALLLASSRLFGTLTTAINALWGVPDGHKSNFGAVFWRYIRGKLLSMAGVLTVGLVFLALIAARFALTFVAAFSEDLALLETISFWEYAETAIAFTTLTILFAVLFRVMPDRRCRWRPLILGGAITAVLMLIGRSLISRYLGTATIESAFGAAGSVVVFLFWAYYSALVFLFGAQLTHVIAMGQYRTSQGTLTLEAAPPDQAP